VFFTAEPKKTGENFRDGRAPDRCGELLVGWESVVQEEIGELLDELCALLGRQLKGRGWDLVGFNIDAVRVAPRLKIWDRTRTVSWLTLWHPCCRWPSSGQGQRHLPADPQRQLELDLRRLACAASFESD
jgi:hypothetical protein